MTNDPSKMVGGADAFICDVIADNGDGTWDVRPRIVEIDGKDHPIIEVNAVGGIKAQTGDVVLVTTARNNLDDKKISRFYPPTESNGRIIAVAKPVLQYVFEGDYKFEGDVTIQGNLEVTQNLEIGGDISVSGDASVTGSVDITQDLDVGGDLTVDGETDTGSLIVNGFDWLLHTHSGVMPGGGSTGPGSQ